MAETDQVYPLDPEKVYYSMDELTLDTDEGPKTLRVGSWLNYDPVRIHRMIVREKTMQVDTFEVYNPLMSKLRRADQQYYKQFMGLENYKHLFFVNHEFLPALNDDPEAEVREAVAARLAEEKTA